MCVSVCVCECVCECVCVCVCVRFVHYILSVEALKQTNKGAVRGFVDG